MKLRKREREKERERERERRRELAYILYNIFNIYIYIELEELQQCK